MQSQHIILQQYFPYQGFFERFFACFENSSSLSLRFRTIWIYFSVFQSDPYPQNEGNTNYGVTESTFYPLTRRYFVYTQFPNKQTWSMSYCPILAHILRWITSLIVWKWSSVFFPWHYTKKETHRYFGKYYNFPPKRIIIVSFPALEINNIFLQFVG